MVLVLALSLVAQGLMARCVATREITNGLRLKDITTALGAVYGLLIAVPLVLSGIASMRARRRGRSWFVQLCAGWARW